MNVSVGVFRNIILHMTTWNTYSRLQIPCAFSSFEMLMRMENMFKKLEWIRRYPYSIFQSHPNAIHCTMFKTFIYVFSCCGLFPFFFFQFLFSVSHVLYTSITNPCAYLNVPPPPDSLASNSSRHMCTMYVNLRLWTFINIRMLWGV